MNTNQNIEKSCVRGEEMVSYLYDEMPTAGRMMFESHLIDCVSCTDEFAGLSLARLEVYEWNHHEFAVMETPAILIPYEKSDRISWFENWFGPIFSAPKLSAGGALAFAALVLGFFAYPSDSLESSVSVSDVSATQELATEQVKPPISAVAEDKEFVEVTAPNSLNRNNDKRVVAASVRTSEPSAKKRRVNETATANRSVPKAKSILPSIPQNAPRLTSFEDEDDNTLRLAELVAEINTDQ